MSLFVRLFVCLCVCLFVCLFVSVPLPLACMGCFVIVAAQVVCWLFLAQSKATNSLADPEGGQGVRSNPHPRPHLFEYPM